MVIGFVSRGFEKTSPFFLLLALPLLIWGEQEYLTLKSVRKLKTQKKEKEDVRDNVNDSDYVDPGP